MDDSTFKGKWDQIKGLIKQRWGKLTDDDLAKIKGKKDELVGVLEERYGHQKDKAKEEAKSFMDKIKKDLSKNSKDKD